MSNADDHDLLLKLVQKVDMLYEEFRRVSNGVGFPRCAERQARIEALEKEVRLAHGRVDALKNRLWWAVSTALAAFGGLILNLLKG